MDPIYSFQITPLDTAALLPQVRQALEKRMELFSRQKLPHIWILADKLNRVQKVPPAVRERRRKQTFFFSLVNWLLSSFLLIPALTAPRELLVPLIIGVITFCISVPVLWKNKRILLAILSLPLGIVLCIGALGSPEELGVLLWLGLADGIIGLGALLVRKRKSSFEQQAEKLLLRRDSAEGMEQVRVTFSPDGMTLGEEGSDKERQVFPYTGFEFVMETEDLLLPICNNSMTILLKEDLLNGTVKELREFLSGQVPYVVLA